ncbi:PTS fructose transporter subunit IIA [Paratractidigestivibacter sp.]|uniref:PTS sugar transporter subunit IIA n=1 Tax=Paratractidigestivibacter sp. TaxID=2847316 RepID=UPI002ABE8A15|nr:PTS fructose transporter subunit IIA [Paratractidigestivibacter sp.]
MRYLLLVSHGTFAPGLHSVVKMLMGDRDDVLSVSLEDGMGADVYAQNVKDTLANVAATDEVVVLADIIGGSPLTCALNVLSEKGLLGSTIAFTGMNLPMAMAAVMELQTTDMASLQASLGEEARAGIMEYVIETSADDDEDDI